MPPDSSVASSAPSTRPTITAVVNTADDTVLHGLAISPDLDTVTYTLAGAIDPERGWGLVDESWRAMECPRPVHSGPPARVRPPARPGSTSATGTSPPTSTARPAGRGRHAQRGHRRDRRAWGLALRHPPDDRRPVRTIVDTAEGPLEFQEYFVGRRHAVAVTGLSFVGAARGTADRRGARGAAGSRRRSSSHRRIPSSRSDRSAPSPGSTDSSPPDATRSSPSRRSSPEPPSRVPPTGCWRNSVTSRRSSASPGCTRRSARRSSSTTPTPTWPPPSRPKASDAWSPPRS